MTVQTSFNLKNGKAHAGMVADAWAGKDVDSRIAGTGGVNPGLAAVDGYGVLTHPSGAITGLAGVILSDDAKEPEIGSEPLFPENEAAPLMVKGRCWVVAEDASTFTIGQAPYVRHTADGALDVLGAFASGAGAGLAQWTAVEVVDVDTQEGLVAISINAL